MSSQPGTTEPAASDPASKAAEASDGIAKVEDPTTADEAAPVKPAPVEDKGELGRRSGPVTSDLSIYPHWPALEKGHPLLLLERRLPQIIGEAMDTEIWGVQLDVDDMVTNEKRFHQRNVLQKFLRANANDVDKAAKQLTETLKWRSDFEASHTVFEQYDKKRFEGVGYVTVIDEPDKDKTTVITWNIYGSVKDPKKTFGELDAFLRWRVALMEIALRHLGFANGRRRIPDFGCGDDPYQIVQVHDYLSVRFFSMDPATKAASKKTIEIFRDHYPEMLSRKFFVNVPIVMGWLFNAMSLFLSKATTNKFTVLSYGNQLAAELGEAIPEVYGGKGASLEQVNITPKLGNFYSKYDKDIQAEEAKAKLEASSD